MYPTKPSKDYAEDWEGRYQRDISKRASRDDNFRLDGKGDLVMIGHLTRHARQRCAERGISQKQALKSSGIRSSKTINAVTATVFNKNEKNKKPFKIPDVKELPTGHTISNLAVPTECVGYIIGRAGNTINNLKMKYQVTIIVEESGATTRNVYVHGIPANVKDALDEIQDIVNNFQTKKEKSVKRKIASTVPEQRSLPQNYKKSSISISPSVNDLVVSKWKKDIKPIADELNVHSVLQNTRVNYGKAIIIWGETDGVNKAKVRINIFVDKLLKKKTASGGGSKANAGSNKGKKTNQKKKIASGGGSKSNAGSNKGKKTKQKT